MTYVTQVSAGPKCYRIMQSNAPAVFDFGLTIID